MANHKDNYGRPYWEEREKKKLKKALIPIHKLEKDLKREYNKAMDAISKEVAFLMSKYAADNNLTYDEANKLLNSKEMKEFRYDLKTYIKLIEETEDEALLLELNTLSMKSRISRLEEIFYQCDKLINELSHNTNNSIQILLSNTLETSYYEDLYNIQKYIGIGTTFAKINKDIVENILKYPWSGNDFSSRIWDNRTKLKKALKEEIVQMVIQGKGLKETSKLLSKRLNASYKNSLRIINTEHARVMCEASKMAYIESEIDKYEIVSTLDKRTSKICQDMDGKVFKVKDGVIGKNMPPFHPNCRTTTVGYIDDEVSTRFARNNKGEPIEIPSNITYKEWLKMYNIDLNVL